MTFAREPLGPFLCGMALYVQASSEEEQLWQGELPSHFTLRRRQASQARLAEVGVDEVNIRAGGFGEEEAASVGVEDIGAVVGVDVRESRGDGAAAVVTWERH